MASDTKLPVIRAVIFDMDGLLIDSEPLWREALVEVFNGVGIPMDEHKCRTTMGRSTPEVVVFWCEKFPAHSGTVEELIGLVDTTAYRMIAERALARRGALTALEFFKKRAVPCALASSSEMQLINIVLDKLKIRDYFSVVHSAEFETYSKPHPAVNITTAHKLGVEPFACLVLEDSWNGVLAAKAGSMKCVCVPDEGLRGDPRLAIADAVIASLEDIDEALWQKLNA